MSEATIKKFGILTEKEGHLCFKDFTFYIPEQDDTPRRIALKAIIARLEEELEFERNRTDVVVLNSHGVASWEWDVEPDTLERNAQRYLWVRENPLFLEEHYIIGGDAIDAAIDAEIAKAKQLIA